MSKNRKGHGYHTINIWKEEEERNGVKRNRKTLWNPVMGAGYSKGRKRTATACEMAVLQQPEQQEAKRYISFTVLKRNQGQGSPTFLTSPSQHPVSQASHLSQISLCSLVKGFTALTCSLESSLLAYSMRRRIHSFPSAVTPWMCFPLKAAVFAVSPRTGRVFNVWSNLQRNISHHVTVRGTKWPAPIFQNNSHQQSTLIPELWLITAAQIVPSFQPTHVAKLVV